jgi:hypothetical protein
MMSEILVTTSHDSMACRSSVEGCLFLLDEPSPSTSTVAEPEEEVFATAVTDGSEGRSVMGGGDVGADGGADADSPDGLLYMI